MTSAKLKLNIIVAKWEKENPIQFGIFLDARKIKTDTLANKWATPDGATFIERLLYELPEDLDILIWKGLEDAESQWLKTQGGAKWFAKTFKQYNVSQQT